MCINLFFCSFVVFGDAIIPIEPSPINSALVTLNITVSPSISESVSPQLTKSASRTLLFNSTSPSPSVVVSLNTSVSLQISNTSSASSSPSPSSVLSLNVSSSASVSMSPQITESASRTLLNLTSPSSSASISDSSSISVSVSPTGSNSLSLTPTSSISNSSSLTSSPSLSITSSITPSISQSITPSISISSTSSISISPTNSNSSSITPSISQSVTPSMSDSSSSSISVSPTVSNSSTTTPSESASITPTISITPTASISQSSTSSVTNSITVSSSISHSVSISPSISQSPTPSISPSPISGTTEYYVDLNSDPSNCGECGGSMICACNTIKDVLDQIDRRSTQNITITMKSGVYEGEGNTNLVLRGDLHSNVIIQPDSGIIEIQCNRSISNGFIIPYGVGGSYTFNNIEFKTCGTGAGGVSKALLAKDSAIIIGNSLSSEGTILIANSTIFNCNNCSFGGQPILPNLNNNYDNMIANNPNVLFDESFMQILDDSSSIFNNCTFSGIRTRSFSQNSVVSSLAARESNLTIYGCNFYSNQAESTSDYTSSCIYSEGSSSVILNIESSTFENNRGPSVITTEDQQLIISDTSFTDHAQGSIVSSYGSIVTISNGNFERNTDAFYGCILGLASKTQEISSTILIQNVLFKANFNYLGYGGAIFLESGSVEVNNCSFEANQARVGGAIYGGPQLDNSILYRLSDKSLTIKNCTFTKNISPSGGAIGFEGNASDISIDDCDFNSNQAPNGQGGAIYITINSNTDTNMNILNNNFSGNSAKDGIGGALFLSGNFILKNNEFKNNTAESAGAMFLDDGKYRILNSSYEDNTAESGGAVYIDGTTIGEFSSNIYTSNNAANSGGALYIRGNCSIKFFKEQYSLNRADSVGGSITVNGKASPIFILVDVENTDTTGSGAINCMGESVPSFIDCTIKNNTASQEGAGIYIQDTSEPVFTNCTISYNNCTTAAGGIVTSENAGGIFQDCKIINNTAANNGGGIKANGNSKTQFFNCSIKGNTAAGDGGGVSIEDKSNAGFIFGTIEDNTATSAGGGVAVHGSTTAFFNTVSIKNNFALSHGGGCSLQDTSEAYFVNCIITDNGTPVNGGGIVAMDLTISTIENCDISNNFAASNGGGIQFISFAEPSFINCTISNNNAASKGGGIQMANYCTPTITNCIINDNSAANGAGISLSNHANPTIESTFIERNIAASQAAGIMLEDNSTGDFNNLTISDNIASNGSGGGIFALDFSNSTFFDCILSNNSATASGAGIQTSSNSCPSFNSCTIENNIITNYGGAVVTIGTSYPSFIDCTIRNNGADTGGGFWIGKETEPYIESTTIFNNFANHRGGGIYIQTGANQTIISSTIQNNTALQGGGIFTESRSRGSISSSSIIENYGKTDGGGAYISCSDTKFNNPIFSENYAVNGGAICIETCFIPDERGEIVNAIIKDNVGVYGGGIYVTTDQSTPSCNIPLSSYDNIESTEYTCINCTFTSNIATTGGGLFISTKDFSITFGPTVKFTGNTVDEFGGGVFIGSELDSNPGSPFLTGAQFSQNKASWAASTVGFEGVPPNMTGDDILLFCLNCYFAADNEVGTISNPGYQTKNGFATPPMYSSFAPSKSCPPSVQLVGNVFDVSIILLDQFNTSVQGGIFEKNKYIFNMTLDNTASSCSINAENTTSIISPVGYAQFSSIILQGENGGSCIIDFTAVNTPKLDPILPTECTVITTGCPPGQHDEPMDNTPYDTCVTNTGISFVSTVVLSSLLIVILVALISIFCYCLLLVHRRQTKKSNRYVGLLPDFDRSQEVTIYDILNDPQIPVIPWEDIVKHEKIGIGGSGLVWRGDLRVKSELRPVALKQLLFGIDNITTKLVSEFLREIKLMSALRHENVVEFLGVSVSNETEEQELYLVTELMQNGSLADLFMKKKYNMPWSLRLRLIQDAACGMAYLHSRNLIHRDLKSQNLLVNDKWICKVSYFFLK